MLVGWFNEKRRYIEVNFLTTFYFLRRVRFISLMKLFADILRKGQTGKQQRGKNLSFMLVILVINDSGPCNQLVAFASLVFSYRSICSC